MTNELNEVEEFEDKYRGLYLEIFEPKILGMNYVMLKTVKPKTIKERWDEKTIEELKEELREFKEAFPTLRTDEEYEQKKEEMLRVYDLHIQNSKRNELYISQKKYLLNIPLSEFKILYCEMRYVLILPLQEEVKVRSGGKSDLARTIKEIEKVFGVDG